MKGLLVIHVVGIGKLVYINLVTYLHLKLMMLVRMFS